MSRGVPKGHNEGDCCINFNYSLIETALDSVNSFKDIGVYVSSDLLWASQINSIVSKCNSIIRMIQRSVGYSSPSSVTQGLYESLVRSQMNYCCPLWAPHCKKSKKKQKNPNI